MRLDPRHTPTLAAGLILACIFAAGAVRYDHFASLSNVANLLSDYSYIAIASAGATLVILLGGIDLSTGSMIAFASVLMAALVGRGWHPLAAAAVCLFAGGGAGLVMGVLIQAFELPAFMVTLVGLFAIRAGGFLILDQSTRIEHPFLRAASHASLQVGDASLTWQAAAGLTVFAGLLFLARWSSFGRSIYAVGGSERAARAMGVSVGRTRVAVYSLAGLCSALAGCVFTIGRQAGDPSSATGLELTVIASVVIGGTLLSGGVGSIVGTMIGVLIIGLIRMIIDFEGTLNAAWTSVATGVLVLAFVLLQKGLGALGQRLGYRG